MKPTLVLSRLLKVAAESPDTALAMSQIRGQAAVNSTIGRPTPMPATWSTYTTFKGPLGEQRSGMPYATGATPVAPLWRRPVVGNFLGGVEPQAGESVKWKPPLKQSGIGTELANRGVNVRENTPSAQSEFNSFSRTANLPANRTIALHEATHAVDPAIETAMHRDVEVPAMTTEMLESIRQGYKPEHNLWIEQMKKHGPKLTGNDTTDVANIESWMKQLRGDTTLGRKYKDWLEQYGK
jgi:hypothetical protein